MCAVRTAAEHGSVRGGPAGRSRAKNASQNTAAVGGSENRVPRCGPKRALARKTRLTFACFRGPETRKPKLQIYPAAHATAHVTRRARTYGWMGRRRGGDRIFLVQESEWVLRVFAAACNFKQCVIDDLS